MANLASTKFRGKNVAGHKRSLVEAQSAPESGKKPKTDTAAQLGSSKGSTGLSHQNCAEKSADLGEAANPSKFTYEYCNAFMKHGYKLVPIDQTEQSENPEDSIQTMGGRDPNNFTSMSTGPGEPPQTPAANTQFMISFARWRTSLYSKELEICHGCRSQMFDALRTKRVNRICEGKDQAAKIEFGEQIAKRFQQDCSGAHCKGNQFAPKSHKGPTQRPKFDESHLDLHSPNKTVRRPTPFSAAGKRFLAPTKAWRQIRADAYSKSRCSDSRVEVSGDAQTAPLSSRSSELLVRGNLELSAFSDEGRLENVDALEKCIRQFAQTAKKHGIPKGRPTVVRVLALKIEGAAYRFSASLITYLRKVETMDQVLRNTKGALACRTEQGEVRLLYEPSVFKMLKEPLLSSFLGETKAIGLD